MSEVFQKRPYDQDPYLIIPKRPYQINVGYQNPSLKCFVYGKGELFGDPMPFELAGLWIYFRLFNSQNVLVAAGEAYVIDMCSSEIEYQWNLLDVKDPGTYYGQFIFKDIDGSKFVLPNKEKLLIVAS